MSVVEDILQGIRGWFVDVYGLTTEQIIPADDKGTRPPLPYLTVKVIVPGSQVGTHERIPGIDGGTGAPTEKIRVERRATVSLQGYGAGAYDWLDTALVELPLPSTQEALDGAGLSVQTLTDITDISRFIDTSTEPRYGVDLAVDYRVESEPVTLIEAAKVGVDFDFDHGEGDPDALTLSDEIDF